MRSLIALPLLVLGLAACSPKAEQTTAKTPPPDAAESAPADGLAGCAVHVDKIWIDQETPIRRYTTEAQTMGPTCGQAIALLVVRAREGSPVFTWAGQTQHIFGLNQATNPTEMKAALEEWIDQTGSVMNTTDKLPPWEETETQSERSEFPFHPESWYDAAAWEALRQEKLDIFCFPQGGESLNCAVLRDGQLETIGLQQFPG